MSLRGKAAIVGVGETLHRRAWPGRTERGLCAEAAAMAIADAGLTREDIDGLVTFGGLAYPGPMAEYIGIKARHYAAGSSMAGCSSGVALTMAASAIMAGMANYILCVFGGGRDPAVPSLVARPFQAGTASEFQVPYGQAVAANTGYGWLYTRHMWKYGTKPEQLALISVRQRYNTLNNPRSAFKDQPITVEDVLNSRYVNEPLHILECVMPVAGAGAFIVTSAERARGMRNKPAYLLGAGVSMGMSSYWNADDMTSTPVKISVPYALEMAGYGIQDMQFAEFYD